MLRARDLIQKDVLEWISANKDRPFFLFYAITLPHGRHEIDDLGIYADKPWTLQQKSYAAQVTRVDSDMGQIIELLKKFSIDVLLIQRAKFGNGDASDVRNVFQQLANESLGL